MIRLVQRSSASAKVLYATYEVSATDQELALLSDADSLVGPEKMSCRMVDQSFVQAFGTDPVTDPEKHVDRPDQGNAERQRLLQSLRFGDRVPCDLNGTIGTTREPEPSRERNERDRAVVIAKPENVEPLRARALRHRALAEPDGLTLISDKMVGDADHPIGLKRARALVRRFGNGRTLLADPESPAKISDPGKIDVESSQQPGLPM